MSRIFNSLSIALASFLLVGCGGVNTTSESHSSTSSSTQPTINSYKVNCLNWSFSGGTQFGGTDQSTNRTALISYLNNGSGLIGDITDSDKIQSGEYGDHSSSVAFQLGSSKANGKFTFSFIKNLTKICVTAESYWKTFDYPNPGTISSDSQSELNFAQNGSLIHSLDLKTSDHGKEDTATIEFNEPIKTISLFTNSFDEEGVGAPGRVMIKTITFYYFD